MVGANHVAALVFAKLDHALALVVANLVIGVVLEHLFVVALGADVAHGAALDPFVRVVGDAGANHLGAGRGGLG